MPSLFSELEVLASNAIDTVYGEPTRIYKQTKGEFFGSETSDVYTEVIGIPDVNPVTVVAQDEGAYDGMQPQLAGERYHVSYDLSRFTVPGTQPKQDDIIDVYGNPEIPKLRVSRVDPDGIGRIVCVCTKAK